MKVKDKVVIVTGGGNGIGRELVLNLLARGANVAAVDLNQKALEETVYLSGDRRTKLSTHIVNITDLAAVEALPQQVISHHETIDGIINNAGIIQPFVDVNTLDYEKIRLVMDVNFYGTLYMTKTLLPLLLERPEAHITNISSMGGFLPVPGQSIYGASKAAVKLLTEALQSELLGTKVKVTVVFPGGVGTNIAQNSGAKLPGHAVSGQAKAPQFLTPKQAAQIIVDGIEADKPRVFAGKDSKLMDLMYRLNPKRAAGLIAKQLKF